MKDRPYSWIFTTVLVLVGLSVAITGSVAAQSTGYVDVAASDLSGSGTAADPYVITNASELQAMEDDVTANYILGQDIDASGTANWNNGAGFDPIDDLGGTFDGTGHTIESITIDRPGEGNVGLFLENGYRSQGGQVYNVTISNADVTGDFNVGILAGSNSGESKITNVDINGTVIGNTNVGGIVGVNQGRLLNSSSDVSVSGSGAAGGIAASSQGSVENISVSGNIDGKNSVGGIIGSNKGTIHQASSNAEINGTEFIGGLVGYNYNTTLLSSANGSVSGLETVGGLAGANSGNVTRTYATGSVNANKKVGGLIGQSFRSGSIVAESFAAGVVTGQSEVGGAIGFGFDTTIKNVYWDTQTTGEQTSAGGSALTTTEMTGTAAETNMEAFEFGSIWQTQPDGYPTLITLSSEGNSNQDESNQDRTTGFVDVEPNDLAGTGTSDDPYIITNASELQAMEDDLDANYTLGNNIDASGTAQWNDGNGFDPVGEAPFSDNEFTGFLNGSDYTISNLVINRPDENYVGLFGSILPPSFSTDAQAVITRLAVSNVSVTGDDYVGGVIGSNLGRINNSYVIGSVSGNNSVGGLTGENMGEFNNGIVTRSYAAVSVDGSKAVGGLSGDTWNGAPDPQSSYWDINKSGQQTSAGGVGLTTDEMTGSTAQSSMSGLNFDNVWNTQSDGYPILARQADDKSDQSHSAQVQLSKVSLTPQSVDLDSESTHQLTFEAQNVSADGSEDEFDIAFPDKVELVSYSNVEIDEKSSDVNKVDNMLEFSVNPTGGGSTQISGELNVTVSATN